MVKASTRVLAGFGAGAVFAGAAAAIISPLLLKTPLTESGHLRSTGRATFLDTATGKPRGGTFVQTSTISTHLIDGRRAGTSTVASYDQRTTNTFVGADGISKVLTESSETQAFDRRTGAGIPGAQADTLGTRAHLFRLPFGTNKQTYRIWDETAKRAVDLVYRGEKTIDGLRTYAFSRDVAPTDLGELPIFKALPGSWFGHPDIPGIPAHEWYENTSSTLYVEPVTGSLVGGASSPHLWAQTTGARKGLRVDLLKVDRATPDAADAIRLVKDAKSARSRALMVHRAPWVLGALGLLLLPGALGIHWRTRPVPDLPVIFLPSQRESLEGSTSELR